MSRKYHDSLFARALNAHVEVEDEDGHDSKDHGKQCEQPAIGIGLCQREANQNNRRHERPRYERPSHTAQIQPATVSEPEHR